MTTTHEQKALELRALAEAVKQWGNTNRAWLDTSEDDSAAVVGHISKDGETYPVAVVYCEQYYEGQDSLKLAQFYAAANPAAILELLDRLASVEAELAAIKAQPVVGYLSNSDSKVLGRNGRHAAVLYTVSVGNDIPLYALPKEPTV